MIAEVDRKLLNWFPAEDRPSPKTTDKSKISNEPMPGDRYECQHRYGWAKVFGFVWDSDVEWIALNCASGVVRFLSHTLFFESRADALRFQQEVR